MKRIYHHFSRCEEFEGGLWRIAPPGSREAYIEQSARLMRDTAAFAESMFRVIDVWPRSCEQNLTATSVNHRAWFGHAGCCLNHGSPEDLTRLAWHTLTPVEQDAANAAADRAIVRWKTLEDQKTRVSQLMFEGLE